MLRHPLVCVRVTFEANGEEAVRVATPARRMRRTRAEEIARTAGRLRRDALGFCPGGARRRRRGAMLDRVNGSSAATARERRRGFGEHSPGVRRATSGASAASARTAWIHGFQTRGSNAGSRSDGAPRDGVGRGLWTRSRTRREESHPVAQTPGDPPSPQSPRARMNPRKGFVAEGEGAAPAGATE